MPNFMTGYPVGADSFYVDGQTHGRKDRETDIHIRKVNVYFPSLRMKVPDHVYVFGSLLLQ
jgi:hypothetical protein